MADRHEIEGWLDRLYADPSCTHMIVKCDTFEAHGEGCYPVYVQAGEDVRARAAAGDRTMEVYSAAHTREEQMRERRAFHYD